MLLVSQEWVDKVVSEVNLVLLVKPVLQANQEPLEIQDMVLVDKVDGVPKEELLANREAQDKPVSNGEQEVLQLLEEFLSISAVQV